MKKVMALALVSLVAFRYANAAQEQKLPIPAAADQKKAESEIRAIFKDEFAKKERSAKLLLAQRLLAESSDPKNTSASRYAVLTLSRDLAIDCLDISTIFKSIEKMETFYEIAQPPLVGATFTRNLNALKIESLNKAQKSATTPEEISSLGEAYLLVAEESLKDRLFDDAVSASQAAEKYGKSAKIQGVSDRASTLGKEVAELRKEDEEFGKVITNKADDPAARLVKGRYSLFVMGDDKTGIDMLVGCSDEGLKNVVKMEQVPPANADGMMTIGEAWLSLSAKESNVLQKRRYKERGIKWFDLALKEAGGIQRTKIEKRLAELLPKSTGVTAGLVGHWMLDEESGQPIHDNSTKRNHGTQSGAKSITGVFGSALKFSGKDSYCTLGVSGMPEIQNPKTISFWYCTETIPGPSVGEAQVMIGLSSGPGATTIGFWQSKLMVWSLGGGVLGSSEAPTVQKWHHVAYTFDGTVSKLYVDGTLQDTNREKPQSGAVKKLEFARWDTGAFFAGAMDEVRIYNRALSEAEVKSLLKK